MPVGGFGADADLKAARSWNISGSATTWHSLLPQYTTADATNDSLAIPEVDLQLRSQAIVAKTRKLKAVWSPEFAQDLNAYHSVDAEAELTSMLSEYISLEIDLEILDMLIGDAVTQDYWSVTPGEDYDGTGTSEDNWAITTF